MKHICEDGGSYYWPDGSFIDSQLFDVMIGFCLGIAIFAIYIWWKNR